MNKAYYLKTNQNSLRLLSLLIENKQIFNFPIFELLQKKEAIKINSYTELQTLLLELEQKIALYTQDFNPQFALPVFVQAATDFYHRKKYKPVHQQNIGLALKSSCTFLFENVWEKQVATENTLLELSNLACAVMLYESLHSMSIFYYLVEDIQLTITASGIRTPIKYQALNQEVYRLTSKTNSFRTIHDIIKIIWKDMNLFQQNILQILTTKKNGIKDFENTIFQSIPSHCTEFWLGIYLRIMLYNRLLHQRLMIFKKEDVDNLMGIQLFKEFQISLQKIAAPEVVESCIKKLFWNKEMDPGNLFNERGNILAYHPVIRISSTPIVFVSSPYFLLDSLNTFIEASVMNYRKPSAANLPACVFNDFISKPFEQKTLQLFAKICGRVGEVSDKGVWNVAKDYIKLSEQKSPGQIDILAADDQNKILYIVEAKVLKDPFTLNAFRNLIKKVGAEDDDHFHAKLSRKMEWLKTATSQFKDYKMIGILVLDKYTPLGWQAENIVLDIAHLEELIRRDRLVEYCEQNALSKS